MWREIERGGDLGLLVEAPDGKALFEQCRRALYELLFGALPAKAAGSAWSVLLEGADDEELAVAWFNELLFLLETGRGCLISSRYAYDPSGPSLAVEGCLVMAPALPALAIKAATYGGLRLDPGPPVRLEITFDL